MRPVRIEPAIDLEALARSQPPMGLLDDSHGIGQEPLAPSASTNANPVTRSRQRERSPAFAVTGPPAISSSAAIWHSARCPPGASISTRSGSAVS